jgi:hypothetical protein
MFFASAVPFITPTVAAASIGVSGIFQPLTTAMYGAYGAIQGIIGMYALSAFGFTTCTVLTAGMIGFLAGAAIAAPFLILTGLRSILPSSLNEDGEPSIGDSIAGFALNVGIMFIASLVISTSMFLGPLPAVAITVGAVVADLALEAVKGVANYAMS